MARMVRDIVAVEELLTTSLLQSFIDPDGTIRQIVIGIANKTNVDWEGLNVYFSSGTSHSILPETVSPGMAGIYTARKIMGFFALGVVGVASFYNKNEDKTLCVHFSVPFNRDFFENHWNAKVYGDKRYANKDIYNDLNDKNSPLKGNDCYYDKDIGKGYKVKGYMTSSEKSVLLINILEESRLTAATLPPC